MYTPTLSTFYLHPLFLLSNSTLSKQHTTKTKSSSITVESFAQDRQHAGEINRRRVTRWSKPFREIRKCCADKVSSLVKNGSCVEHVHTAEEKIVRVHKIITDEWVLICKKGE